MADRPQDFPRWAELDKTDPESGQQNVIEPTESRKDYGWDYQELPPRQFLNWLGRTSYKWFLYIVDILDAATSSATASTLVERDANGRTQVADPSVAADAANKGYVDTGDSDTLSSAQSYTDAAVDDLSGVTDAAGARTNLDVYSTGEADAAFLDESSNLSDLPDKATARSNLDVYSTEEAAQKPGNSSEVALAFDSPRVPNSNRPVFLVVEASAFTDGSIHGDVRLKVDEGSDASYDYFHSVAFSPEELGSGAAVSATTSTIIPAGGGYAIENTDDPTGNNAINSIREFVL